MMLVTFYIVAKCVVCALIQDCGHYTNLRGHTNMRHKGQISTDVHTASYSMRTVGISQRSTVRWLKRLVTGFSPQRLTFDSGPVHVEHKCQWQEGPFVQSTSDFPCECRSVSVPHSIFMLLSHEQLAKAGSLQNGMLFRYWEPLDREV